MPSQEAVETVSIQPAEIKKSDEPKKEEPVVVPKDNKQTTQGSTVKSGADISTQMRQASLSFTDKRGVSHNGFFYTQYDTEEACRQDTDKFIKELHQELGREVVGGYTVVYNDTLNSYVAKYVGLDGLPIKDSRILTPEYYKK